MILVHHEAQSLKARVATVSQGRVSVPSRGLMREEAIALWNDVQLVFGAGPDGSRRLVEREAAELRAKALFRSHGRVDLSGLRLSLVQGLAAWRLSLLLGRVPVSVASSGAAARGSKLALVASGALSLAACTSMFGGNVKGSFACSAPGGTCAPSTMIDDQALAVIQNARPITPAGQYTPPQRGGVPQTALVPVGSGRVAVAGNGSLHRERRVLKVVFPAFVDGNGNLHEARVVHTVTDEGGWMQLSSGEANVGEQVVGRADARSRAEVTSGLQAPVPSSGQGQQLLASAPELANFSLTQGAKGGEVAGAGSPSGGQPNSASAGLSGVPSPAAVEAARRRGPIMSGNPLDVIKARVAAQLGQPLPGAAESSGPPASAVGGSAEPKTAPQAVAPASAGQPPQAKADTAPRALNAPSVFPVKVEE